MQIVIILFLLVHLLNSFILFNFHNEIFTEELFKTKTVQTHLLICIDNKIIYRSI